ncbi:serine hydrolase [Acidobacteria bacterium AH-259-A15]|nr:serine hydrolase [Acidobacteria bacterium AH-259-A15]
MKRTQLISLSVILVCCCVVTLVVASAQEQRLEVGRAVERELAGGQSHGYLLELGPDHFVFLVVEQLGIDVVVQVKDPKGQTVTRVDSPSGTQGPEPVSFFTRSGGLHRIKVTPLEDKASPGRYAIEILRREAAAASPSGKVDQLMAQWDQPHSPGAALAVIRDSDIIYSNGYGLAHLEYDVPISPSTIFHVASVSKQFTAFAVGLLAEQGKLSLDDDVRRHIAEIPDFGKKITLRHLIHHTSGLRDQWNLLALAGWRLDDVITREQILTAVRHQKELNFDPGEEYLYCNTGYTLLGEVVARVSGQTFREWTTENIFKPLGMTRTHFHDDHRMVVPDRAYSYSAKPGGFRKSVLSYANAGATSLFTTVEDLARWAHNLDTGTLGGAALREEMHRRGVLNSGKELPYASGLVHGEHRGLETVGHGGGDAGFRSVLTRYPKKRFAVAVLSNLASFNPTRIARQVVEIYLGDQMSGREPGPESSEDQAAKPSIEIDEAVLETYTGVYKVEGAGLVISVKREADRLTAQATGRPAVSLVPESEAIFLIREVNARLTFQPDPAGKVDRFTLLQGGQEMTGRRVEPFEPTVEELAQYEGEYLSSELQAIYAIAVQDSKLTAQHRRHGTIELSPVARDEFSGSAWYFRYIRFIRNDSGGIIGMRVSNGRVRNVLFDRRSD